MMNQCRNCSASFTSPYCPDCGQKAGTGRLTMHNLLHELWHGFTHTDKGIIKLWLDLLMHPAAAYNNYFSGKRKSYFSPVVFFLLSFGLYIYFDQKVFDYQDYIFLKLTGRTFNNEIGRYVQEHSKYMALTLLPLQALLTYLFFHKRYNLAECITFWLFCVAFSNTILIISTPIRLLFIDNKGQVDFILTFVVMAVYIWHTMAVFGNTIFNKINCLLIILIVAIAAEYVAFYFLSSMVRPYYPGIWDAIRIIFTNVSPTYNQGKWTLE